MPPLLLPNPFPPSAKRAPLSAREQEWQARADKPSKSNCWRCFLGAHSFWRRPNPKTYCFFLFEQMPFSQPRILTKRRSKPESTKAAKAAAREIETVLAYPMKCLALPAPFEPFLDQAPRIINALVDYLGLLAVFGCVWGGGSHRDSPRERRKQLDDRAGVSLWPKKKRCPRFSTHNRRLWTDISRLQFGSGCRSPLNCGHWPPRERISARVNKHAHLLCRSSDCPAEPIASHRRAINHDAF